MGFNKCEVRVKATSISVVDRKRGESILGCRVVSGAITVTVFLFVSQQLYAKFYECFSMKFSGSVGGGTRKNRLDFGSYW